MPNEKGPFKELPSQSLEREVSKIVERGDIWQDIGCGHFFRGLSSGLESKVIYIAQGKDEPERYLSARRHHAAMRRHGIELRVWHALSSIGALIMDEPSDEQLEKLKSITL